MPGCITSAFSVSSDLKLYKIYLATRAERTRMTNWIEIVFNLIWVGVIVVCAIITIVIMKKRDPFDDGPSLDEEHD